MLTTPYMPIPEINTILKRRNIEINTILKRRNILAMWYFEKETNTIVICTTRPGYWIGKAGVDHEKLLADINKVIDDKNELLISHGYDNLYDNVNIKYIECSC